MVNPKEATDQKIDDIWSMLKKEIAGIQLLWEIIEGLTKDDSRHQKVMKESAPRFWGLTTAVYLESLISRFSRLMDPQATGSYQNVSLARLGLYQHLNERIKVKIFSIQNQWKSSAVDVLRNKLLAHNDFERFKTTRHTINLPITQQDLTELGTFVGQLFSLRNEINRALGGASVLNTPIASPDCNPASVFRQLIAGDLFFTFLPESEQLQQAWMRQEGSTE